MKVILRARMATIRTRQFSFACEGETYELSLSLDEAEQLGFEQDLIQRAWFDELTGLPNRGLIERSVSALIEFRGQPVRPGVHRHQRLQAHQRLLRTSRGRSGPEAARRAPGRRAAQFGPARPPQWRRIRPVGFTDCRGRSARARCRSDIGAHRGAASSSTDTRSSSRPRSASASFRSTAVPTTNSCRMPTARCIAARAAGRDR